MLDLFNVLDEIESSEICVDVIGTGVPTNIANIVHYVYLAIQVLVPVLLIIYGMIGLAKAIMAQKDDEIKAAQGALLKKAIVAILVFLVFTLVRFVFGFAGGSKDVWGCVDALING